jgi:hypothetical protein
MAAKSNCLTHDINWSSVRDGTFRSRELASLQSQAQFPFCLENFLACTRDMQQDVNLRLDESN